MRLALVGPYGRHVAPGIDGIDFAPVWTAGRGVQNPIQRIVGEILGAVRVAAVGHALDVAVVICTCTRPVDMMHNRTDGAGTGCHCELTGGECGSGGSKSL